VNLEFTLFPDAFAVARLDPSQPAPVWATGGFLSITRTADELSVVCRADLIPAEARADRGWRCLKLEGPFALTETGIAAEFTSILAAAGVSVFVISTFDTDYLLVKNEHLPAATASLRKAGHVIR
jgi:hypothetical protein